MGDPSDMMSNQHHQLQEHHPAGIRLPPQDGYNTSQRINALGEREEEGTVQQQQFAYQRQRPTSPSKKMTTETTIHNTNLLSASSTAFLSVHDLVHFAITTSTTKSATLREIYSICEKHGRIAHKHNRKSRLITSNVHWKSQVRHALYTSKRFTRTESKGEQSDRWRVVPQFENAPVHTVVVDDANETLLQTAETTNGLHSNSSKNQKKAKRASIATGKEKTSNRTSSRISRKNNNNSGVTTTTTTTTTADTTIALAAAAANNSSKALFGGTLLDEDATHTNPFLKRSLVDDEDFTSLEENGRKLMRMSPPHPRQEMIEHREKNSHQQRHGDNGAGPRPLSPLAEHKLEIPVFGPNELRNLKGKPRNLLRNRRKSSSASVGQAPHSPDAIDKLNEYFPKDSTDPAASTMFSFF